MKLEYSPKPVVADYRILPISQGFNWLKIINQIVAPPEKSKHQLYLVVFRSVRKANIDDIWVTLLDDAAHEEAKRSEALLHYFAGDMDEQRRAMSWCLWTDMAAAREALSGPAHREAVREARTLYDDFTIELYDVHQIDRKDVSFQPVFARR